MCLIVHYWFTHHFHPVGTALLMMQPKHFLWMRNISRLKCRPLFHYHSFQLHLRLFGDQSYRLGSEIGSLLRGDSSGLLAGQSRTHVHRMRLAQSCWPWGFFHHSSRTVSQAVLHEDFMNTQQRLPPLLLRFTPRVPQRSKFFALSCGEIFFLKRLTIL